MANADNILDMAWHAYHNVGLSHKPTTMKDLWATVLYRSRYYR